jgi:hypothetical protein
MPLPACAHAVLSAVGDAIYPPPLGGKHAPDVLLSSLPKYIDTVIEGIESLPDHEVFESGMLMRALNTGAGTAAIFGVATLTHFAGHDIEVPHPHHPNPLSTTILANTRSNLSLSLSPSFFLCQSRARMLAGIRDSSLGDRRKIFNGLKRILAGTALSYSVLSEEEILSRSGLKKQDINPMWEAIGYMGPPIVHEGAKKDTDPIITDKYVRAQRGGGGRP